MAERKEDKIESIIKKYFPQKQGGKRNFLPLYADQGAMDLVLETLAGVMEGKADYVAAPEPMGFILGSMLSERLGTGFVGLRKGEDHFSPEEELYSASYIDHRDEVQCLKLMKSALKPGDRVLLADDWIETAATIQTAMTLMEEAGAVVTGIVSLGAEIHPVTRDILESGLVTCLVTL